MLVIRRKLPSLPFDFEPLEPINVFKIWNFIYEPRVSPYGIASILSRLQLQQTKAKFVEHLNLFPILSDIIDKLKHLPCQQLQYFTFFFILL